METNPLVIVLDEGVEEDIEEMTACCKTGAPAKLKTTTKKCKAGGPAAN